MNKLSKAIDNYIDKLKDDLNAPHSSNELDTDTGEILKLLTILYDERTSSSGQTHLLDELPTQSNPNKQLSQMLALIGAVSTLATCHTTVGALSTTVEQAAKVVEGEGCSVWLLSNSNRDKIVCAKSHATDGRVIPGVSSYTRLKPNGKYDGLTGYVFATGQALRLRNIKDKSELAQVSRDLLWSDKYEGWASQHPQDKRRPFLAVPITSASNPNEIIGVLRVATTKSREPFTEIDESVLTLFATVLSLVMARTQRTEHYRALIQTIRALDTIPPMGQLLDTAATAFPSLFDGSHASILLLEEDGKYHIRATSAAHLKERIFDNTLTPYEAGQGKTGRVIETGTPLLYVEDKGLISARPSDQCESLKPATSFIAAPLSDANGQVRGIIRSSRCAPAPAFTQADLELLEEFAAIISEKLNIRDEFDMAIREAVRHVQSQPPLKANPS